MVIQGGLYLAERADPSVSTWATCLLAIVSGGLLTVGLLTPFVAAFVGLGTVAVAFSLLPITAPNFFDAKLSAVFATAMSAAVVLLGPGAFSVDARLFGRREIIIPPASRPRD
jgi:uncharacterized membrane protein YphA (DoxX/SURF4 family)